MPDAVGTPTPEEAQWLLSVFATVHRKPFDARLFAQRFPPPIDSESLRKAAGELGLDYAARSQSIKKALDQRFPVALLCGSRSTGPVSSRWALLLNSDEQSALVLRMGESAPTMQPLASLESEYQGVALTLHPTPPAVSDPDGVAASDQRFNLRWFIPELLKHRKIWNEVLVASLALQLMALAIPLFTQVIIDKVIVHRTESTLIALAVGMALFLVFTAILSWVRQYLILHTGNRVDAVLGAAVFEHLFKLPPAYFQHRPTGVISARLHGIESIREFIASAAVTLILDLPFMLLFVAVMAWYSVTLTAIVLCILAVLVGLSILVGPLFQTKLNDQFLRGAATQAFVTEYVAGVETVKSLQFEPQLNQRYRDLLAAYLKSCFATRQLANTYGTWAQALEQLMTLAVLVIGAWLVMTTTALTVGMLVAFQMFAQRVSQPMLRLVGLWQQWQQTKLAVVRLGDVMNAPVEPYSAVPRRAGSGAGRIQIESIAFRYADSLPYLYEDLSLTLEPGQLVALMGPSGAGKSTLAKLLQGFYQVNQGAIRIDGIDIRHLSANELRSCFGVVPQETVLFTGTILENLRLANLYSTFDQVVAACKMAEIHAAIEALPNGYQTELGERGSGLSGGQRQRISIARALLKGPKVLIFDEATSAVDPMTAEQLGRTIHSLKGRVTILFIAHALPRALQPDHVVRIGEKLSVVAGAGADRSERADTEQLLV